MSVFLLWISLIVTPNTLNKILSNHKEKLFHTWYVTFRINLLPLHAVTSPNAILTFIVTSNLRMTQGLVLLLLQVQQLMLYVYVMYFTYQLKYRQV